MCLLPHSESIVPVRVERLVLSVLHYPADITAGIHETKVPVHLKDLYQRSTKRLEPDEKCQVHSRLCEFAHLFSRGPQDLGRTDIVKPKEAAPIRQRPHRLPLAKREEAQQMIEQMHHEGVI